MPRLVINEHVPFNERSVIWLDLQMYKKTDMINANPNFEMYDAIV